MRNHPLRRILKAMRTGAKTPAEADHRRFVGENLMLARVAARKRQADWVRAYPTWITSQSKLSNWENGVHYPPVLFLMVLCEDYGLTLDWFYRRRRAGVSSELVDGLREAEADMLGTSSGQAHRVP